MLQPNREVESGCIPWEFVAVGRGLISSNRVSKIWSFTLAWLLGPCKISLATESGVDKAEGQSLSPSSPFCRIEYLFAGVYFKMIPRVARELNPSAV
jgi:hypothetical protein